MAAGRDLPPALIDGTGPHPGGAQIDAEGQALDTNDDGGGDLDSAQ